jgi:hypothetical protein
VTRQEAVNNFVAGDYQLACHVIEARELRGRQMDGTADPYAKLTCLGDLT